MKTQGCKIITAHQEGFCSISRPTPVLSQQWWNLFILCCPRKSSVCSQNNVSNKTGELSTSHCVECENKCAMWPEVIQFLFLIMCFTICHWKQGWIRDLLKQGQTSDVRPLILHWKHRFNSGVLNSSYYRLCSPTRLGLMNSWGQPPQKCQHDASSPLFLM